MPNPNMVRRMSEPAAVDPSSPAGGLRRRPPRARLMLIIGSVLSAALVAVVIFSFTTRQKQSGNGCIDFDYITMIGGAEMYKCGQDARNLCASPVPANDSNPGFYVDLHAACRKAGLPYPS